MEIRPSLLSYIFTSSTSWRIDYEFPKLRIEYHRESLSLGTEQILETVIQKGWIWSTVTLRTIDQTYQFQGLWSNQAEKLQTEIYNDKKFLQHQRNANQIKIELGPSLTQYQEFMTQNCYLSHSYTQLFRTDITQSSKAQIDRLNNIIQREKSFSFEPQQQNLFEKLKQFIDLPIHANYAIDAKNEAFIKNELIIHKDFFDHVESTPLTKEQRIASIIFEDRNLLIAAAGSGKTSTIVGKVGYALLTELYKPEEILVLAFNKNAGEELNARINLRLKSILEKFDTKIEALNFHQLGVRIIGHATGKSPSVSKHANNIQGLLNQIIQHLNETDPNFEEKYLLFKTAYYKTPLSPFSYKTKNEWDKAEKQSFDRFKDGFTTYQGELVKSHGEKAIANWLYSQGIPYEYERNYEHDTADENHRQYKPDFYFPDINLYLEHYALDQYGNPPTHFGQKYLDEMNWKKTIHQKYKTDLISTTFHEFITGSIFEKLKYELKKRGQLFQPRSLAEVNSKAFQIYESDTNELYSSFLSHYKSNQASITQLLANQSLTLRQRIFLELFSKIYSKYEETLSTDKEYDFDDLLIESTRLINENKYKSPFKLIIIDEFQDTSQSRARLIQALLGQVPKAKLFCVGDDWQAIYRFAGSDISIFTHFAKVFGYTKQTQLTQTFRSNQGIANVASSFIQKNIAQMKKDVRAIDQTTHEVIEINYSTQNKDINKYVIKTIVEIDALNNDSKKKKMIYILARYKHLKIDLSQVLPVLNNCTVQFKTIHSSKGLQADYVIVIGLNKGTSGFPSEKADDPLLDLVLPQPEKHPFAEERRLFYVALTRAKEKAYLVGERNSVFLEEIVKDPDLKNFIHIVQDEHKSINGDIPAEWLCPKCENGRLWKRNGPYGPFMSCNNRNSNCGYTRKIRV